MTETHETKGLGISARSFIVSLIIIFALMLFTYVLTFVIPGGEFARTVDASGNTIVDTAGGFRFIDGGIPFWKWLLSPFLVLGAQGNGTLIAVIVFLLVIGGVFNALTTCGLLNYMLDKIVWKFGAVRYRLMAALIFFFMAMGSFVGSFEEVVPITPIVVALAVELGWDRETGLAMSLLATGCGFAAGIANPFTVGIAQGLAGLPMFSGIWFRVLSFVLIYVLLFLFLRTHARKAEGNEVSFRQKEFSTDPRMDKALLWFALILGAGILLVISSGFIHALQDYTMIIVALMFLVAGIISVLLSGSGFRFLAKSFVSGIVSISPSILMILMATSIKYTMEESNILDTILHATVNAAEAMPKAGLILFIYLICLVMNFFIPSGSAKAFLLIPLITPLAQIFGIPAQLCVVAYAYGDGFSNVFYATNPALLISLGLVGVAYGNWAKFSVKFQLMNLVMTAALLLFGLAVGYC